MEAANLTVENPSGDKSDAKSTSQSLSNHEASENHFCFKPPLYIQRYDYVGQLLKKYDCKTYIDIGCAECKLLRYVKNTNPDLNLIVGVDIDKQVLINGREILCNSWFDYIQPRENPLEIHLIKGDISMPSDYFIEQLCYENTDLDCVSMVEIIEHMYPDVLEKAMETVFQKLKPRVIVVTTPNFEFNVVFENFHNEVETKEKGSKFRHWDHKFEWTRKEFHDWCEILLNKYTGYELICYDGLGLSPDDHPGVGPCSQIAIFQKVMPSEPPECDTNFKNHLTKKMQLNYLTYDQKQRGDEKTVINPYLDQQLFDSEDQGFSIFKSILYPFEIFEFENISSRNLAVIEELDSLLNFLTKPPRMTRDGFCEMNTQEDEILTEDEKQRLKNSISLGDQTVRLCSVEKLFSFSIIKKFKMPNAELIDLMKINKYEFTKDQSHIIHRNFIDSDDEYDSYEYERSSYSEENERFNDESSVHDNNQSSNVQFGDEDWDDEIETIYKPTLPPRVFSPEEQFGDDDLEENEKNLLDLTPPISDRSGMISDEENFSSLTNSSISTDLELNEYEINYRAFEVKQLALKFKKIKKRIRKEEREKLKSTVQHDCIEEEQFRSEF